MRLLLAAVFALAATAVSAAAAPSVSFVVDRAAPGQVFSVRVAGVSPGRARLALQPGDVLLHPVFRVNRRRTAQFRATVPNVVAGEYRVAVVRDRRTIARSARRLRIVEAPPGARGCESAVYGDLDPAWEQGSLRVGPIAFVGMSRGVTAESLARSRNRAKALVVVDNGAVVTVRVVEGDRSGVALDYTTRNVRRVADGQPAMTFRACSESDRPPHTQFNGGFVVDRPRCAHLEVRVAGRPDPLSAALALGAPC